MKNTIIKKIKAKKLNNKLFKLEIKGTCNGKGKYTGTIYVKVCERCGEPYITNDILDLFCGKCKREMDKEISEILKDIKPNTNPLGALFEKILEDIKKDKTKNVSHETNKSEECKSVKTNPHSVYAYSVSNLPKIDIPKYDEKYKFLKKNRDRIVNYTVGMKLMELLANGKTIDDMCEIMNLKKSSVITYLNDLRFCGLVIKVNSKYMINPAIEYKLIG